ncbi:unnamed protein product, partial [marine sediment metagenome]
MKDERDNFNLAVSLFIGLSLVAMGNQEPVLLIPLATLCYLTYSILETIRLKRQKSSNHLSLFIHL